MHVDYARRLTGPGLMWDHPGAVMNIIFVSVPAVRVTKLWNRHARKVLDAFDWQDQR